MAMCDTKPVLKMVKGNPGHVGNGNTNQPIPNSNTFPSRPLPPRSDVISEDVSHQRWMQEYHNSRQSREGPNSKQQPAVSNGYTVISPCLLNPQVPLNSATVKLNGLQINPDVNEAQRHGLNELGMSLKLSKTDILEGYKVYRGPNSATLGSTRNHTENSSPSMESPKCALYYQDTKGVTNDSFRRPNLPAFYYPDHPLTISKHVAKDGPNQKMNPEHFHVTKSHSLPFRGHFPSRPRPQSATLSSATQKPDEKVKGPKSKHNLRKGRPALHVSTKGSSLKQGQSSKSTDTQNSQHRGSFTLSPRQLGAIPRPSYKLDVNGGPKVETNANLTPKSILKNNNYADANSYLAIHSLKPSHEMVRDTCGQVSPYLLPSELSFNDLFISPRESNRASTSVSNRSALSSSHTNSTTNRTALSPKRPMSAVVNSSKYEINESPPSGRKSVTFNSYVSLMTGNRVSTIRSLSVDA